MSICVFAIKKSKYQKYSGDLNFPLYSNEFRDFKRAEALSYINLISTYAFSSLTRKTSVIAVCFFKTILHFFNISKGPLEYKTFLIFIPNRQVNAQIKFRNVSLFVI